MVRAIEQIRRMRGGAQSQLMGCDDGKRYIVKFRNNPQGRRVLVNEFVASRLATVLGLPVPEISLVEVSEEVIEHWEELVMQLGRGSVPCAAGIQFGSRHAADRPHTVASEIIAFHEIQSVKNLRDFLGMLVFDKWTCNTDGRQVIYSRRLGETASTAWMIDQGFCFGQCNWDFPDAPLRGLYYSHIVYQLVWGLDSFEPWLTQVETKITVSILENILAEVPEEWLDRDRRLVERMLERLYYRRTEVRNLLNETRKVNASSFPNWKQARHQVACAGQLAAV
jgi:HipA-like protein